MSSTFSQIFKDIETEFGMECEIVQSGKNCTKKHSLLRVTLYFYDCWVNLGNCEVMKLEYISVTSPELDNLVEDLVKNARSILDNATFKKWCDAFGYNNSSTIAKVKYNECRKQTRDFKRLVGDDIFKKFMECDMI